ncbi:transposase [Sulfoacidibacillus ferrooxidans]
MIFRYLSANQFPDFRTINTFRKRHLERFETLFVQVCC